MYGKLRAATFRRVIAPPDWSNDMTDFRKLGGWGIDLHIHDNHYISLLCGVPGEVYSRGILAEGFVNHVCTQYLFEEPETTVSCTSGGIAAAGLKFAHGFSLFLERATLEYDGGTYGSDWVANRPLTLILDDGTVSNPDPGGGGEWCSAFTDELQAAINAVETGDESPILSGRLALDALKMCHAEAESIRTNRAVSIR
jgi:predicted dehydrogenase